MQDVTESPGTRSLQAYSFGRFRLDLVENQLWRDRDPVPLTPKALATLGVLIRNRERVVLKEELIKLVWPDAFVSDESLTQNIWGIRRALGDDTARPEFIATIPRRGYRFIAPVIEITAEPAPSSNVGADTAAARPAETQQYSGEPSVRHRTLAPASVALALIALGVLLLFWFARVPTQAPAPVVTTFVETAPVGVVFLSGGILSPDGRHLAAIGRSHQSDSPMIWLRSLDSQKAQSLAGTEGATGAFWSPDSQNLGFFSGNKLKRIAISNGHPQVVATMTSTGNGGSWSPNGTMLFGDPNSSGIHAVSADGGETRLVTALDKSAKEWSHSQPQFLPDGRHFLFFVVSTVLENTGMFAGSLDSTNRVRISPLNVRATFLPPGYLLYAEDNALVARHFDDVRLRLDGDPVLVAGSGSMTGRISGSVDGSLVYGGGPQTDLAWFDRMGRRLGPLEAPVPLRQPVFFRNRGRLFAQNTGTDRGGIWLVDVERGGATRRIADSAAPIPSPDGTHFFFSSARLGGVADIYRRPIDGTQSDETFLRSNETKDCQDISPDGQFLIYGSVTRSTQADLWIVPTSGERHPSAFLATPANEFQARVSPDGHWIAYTSDESSQFEVYIQSFPSAGHKQVVSTRGGSQPQWRPDGRELFYLGPDRTLMSVTITPGPTIGSPKPLFPTTIVSNPEPRRPQYAVSSDGQKFLVEAAEDQPMHVILNWPTLLRRSRP